MVICAVDDPARQGLPSHNFVSHKCVPFTVVTCKDTVITACTQQILTTYSDIIDNGAYIGTCEQSIICTENGAIGLTSFPGHNFPLLVFDGLQYAKMEGKAWVVLSYAMSDRYAEVSNQGPSLLKDWRPKCMQENISTAHNTVHS